MRNREEEIQKQYVKLNMQPIVGIPLLVLCRWVMLLLVFGMIVYVQVVGLLPYFAYGMGLLEQIAHGTRIELSYCGFKIVINEQTGIVISIPSNSTSNTATNDTTTPTTTATNTNTTNTNTTTTVTN